MKDPVYVTAWLTCLLFFASRANLRSWVPFWSAPRYMLDVAGVISLCLHMVMAYWLTHHWSHAAATEHVAERTNELLGLRSGLGIYANFAVVIAWTVLTVFEQKKSTASCSNQHVSATRQGLELFLWLMFVSASIVFAKPISAAVFSAIALASVATRWISRPDEVGGRESGDDKAAP